MSSSTSVGMFTLLDGTTVPWLAWGHGNIFGKEVVAAGIKHIDTAQVYQTEAETGQVVKESGLPKEEIYVTSKCLCLPIQNQISLRILTAILHQVSQLGPDQSIPLPSVRPLIEESLAKLGCVPDLFLIHNPFVAESTEDLKKIWGILEDLKDEGKLKSLGVSNFRPQDLEVIASVARYPPVVNQIEFHPYVLTHLEPVLAIQAEMGIKTAAYGPLTPIFRHSTGGPLKPVLERIAARLSSSSALGNQSDVDTATVLLLWLHEHDVIAVTGTQKPDRLKNLAALVDVKKGTLTKEEVDEIDRIGKTVHYRHYKEHMTEDFPEPALPDGTEI